MTAPLIAVLDTNVVVSGLISPHGPPGRILGAMAGSAFVAANDARIVSEYEAVLARPRLGIDRSDREQFLALFMRWSLAVVPAVYDEAMPDESDREFVEVALGARAVIVTDNGRHYPEDERVVQVMTPARFWGFLGGD
jgi:putative PIN family toxin of toxin-antitoxin system